MCAAGGMIPMQNEAAPQKALGEGEAKAYNAIKIRLTVSGILINFLLLAVFAFTPISGMIVNYIEFYILNPYLQFLFFACAAGAVFTSIELIIDFYGGYFIEHEFGLSTQTFRRWMIENIKSWIISLVIGIPMSLMFYFLIRTLGADWWWVFALVVFSVSVLLARVAPALIFPLFYRFTLIGEGEIRSRICALLDKEKIPFKEIYSFNMSKNTRKANAGFTGIGSSKRIILSDTLLERFTPDEIEVIFAHELGHFRGRHILKNIALSGVIIFSSFYICGLVYQKTLFALGFINLSDIAALPALLLYLSVFSMLIMPATNALSRLYERDADEYAIRSTGRADAFISGMKKLGEVNLADTDPHPVIEFLFHGHPSISRRIMFAEKMKL